MTLREQADQIISAAIRTALPDVAVKKCLRNYTPPEGRTVLISAGKAAWQMASAAVEVLGNVISSGVVITKYGHVMGELPGIQCFEGAHPVPDENGFRGTQAAIDAVSDLTEADRVLFLLSGGGSALFEKPLISGEELGRITDQLLSCGAEIGEINTIRKRLSAVKGGKFGALCSPAPVECIILSDVLGDRVDTIASGPTCPDSTTSREALNIAEKYHLDLSPEAESCLHKETVKSLPGVSIQVIGSVRMLCRAAADACRALDYEPVILTDCLGCEAREAGNFLGSIARSNSGAGKKLAFIAGGETVVHLRGKGKGGRNQELALAAAPVIAGMDNVAVFSVGSDGTDGVTNAAGGYVDGTTVPELASQGISVYDVLEQNDSYHALKKTGGLIITGPTGTNVNDVAVVLIN